MNYKNKKVVVLGHGVDTQDVIPYLEKQGAEITILDEKRGDKFENLNKYDLIIRSPGVYRFRPEIAAAQKAGVEISSKTKLFFDLVSGLPAGRQAKIIGVTGTKGKGTTATLIFEILKAGGKDVYLGGNIGTGVFEFLPKLTSDSWVVLELSSFQLIDLTKSPHIAVVLMVTSEHQDWHISQQEYLDSKKNIVSHQQSGDFAVVNRDYPNSVAIGKAATGELIWVSKQALKNMDDDEIGLRGEHNRENVVAAVTVAKIVGVNEVIMRQVTKEFNGLEHRLEEVKTVNGIRFFNDSFSTTPETTIAAIKSFSEPLILIVGGSDKGSDYSQLGKTIAEAKNVKTIILIGLMADRIQAAITTFARGGLANGIVAPKIIQGGKNMAEIVKMAYNNAKSGDIVLLSPACASFDMFKNYKDRGNQFKEQVMLLEGKRSK